jgi:hypothetical protein
MPHSRLTALDENSEGSSDGNVAEFEKELQPALEQKKLSSTSGASSPRPIIALLSYRAFRLLRYIIKAELVIAY